MRNKQQRCKFFQDMDIVLILLMLLNELTLMLMHALQLTYANLRLTF